jgi:MFS family permease
VLVDDLPTLRATPAGPVAALRSWPARRWRTALVAGILIALAIGLPTDVIPNPVFGRPVPVTWWSYPVLAITAVLGGLLAATYVRRPEDRHDDPSTAASSDTPTTTASNATSSTAVDGLEDLDRPGRLGSIGGLVSFFAVGCPVCNKLVLLALGTTGARQWFEPIQPFLAAASVVLLAVALRARLRSEFHCAVRPAG